MPEVVADTSPLQYLYQIRQLRLLLAVKLFEVGKAAEFSGLPKLRLLDDLGRLGVPVINLDDDQIADELRDN